MGLLDGLIWLKKKLLQLVKIIGLGLFMIIKFTLSPLVLFIYKNILRVKIKSKQTDIQEVNYSVFIRKYLPSIIIVIIIISATTHNIFAKNYSADEYANRTLLSSIVNNANMEAGWSEITEESAPASNQPQVVAYLEEQGNLQQPVINTPFAEEEVPGFETGTTPDDSSLVLISPEDTDVLQEVDITRRDKSITYVVQSGDVIGKIAEKFGISANTILWENDLSWNSTIRPGQKLIILPDSGITHEVASGDTILAIAKKYQTDADNIVEHNKLADASDIRTGDLLFIPDGVRPTRVVSSYKPIASVYSDETVAPAQTDTGTKLLWPALSHRITQYYHWGHHAIDIGDKTGTPIYAAEAGKVERAGWNTGYGYNIIVNHGNGIKTLYAHASKMLVQAGDSVARGETIGLVGSTGWSTGPHIHFEVRLNGIKQNPLNYIK